jgi:hypothetical protein
MINNLHVVYDNCKQLCYIFTESTVFFPEVLYSVEEKTSKLEIPIFRTGDLSDEFMVICYTAEGKCLLI